MPDDKKNSDIALVARPPWPIEGAQVTVKNVTTFPNGNQRPNKKRQGLTLTTFEHLRTGLLYLALLASALFALFEYGVFTGYIRVDPSCSGVSCAYAGLEVAYACVIYHAICMAALLAKRPAQIGWEMALTLVSTVPLFVLVYWTIVRWGDLTGFKWHATFIFWLTEGVDIVALGLVMLQLTRRSSIGFGVVDDQGHRV